MGPVVLQGLQGLQLGGFVNPVGLGGQVQSVGFDEGHGESEGQGKPDGLVAGQLQSEGHVAEKKSVVYPPSPVGQVQSVGLVKSPVYSYSPHSQ